MTTRLFDVADLVALLVESESKRAAYLKEHGIAMKHEQWMQRLEVVAIAIGLIVVLVVLGIRHFAG